MHCWGFKIIFCVTKKQGGDWIFWFTLRIHSRMINQSQFGTYTIFVVSCSSFFFFWKGGRDVATLQMKCQHCLNWSPWQNLMQYIMAQAMSDRGWAPMCHHYDRWFLNILNVNGFVAKALKIVHLMYLFDSIC